MKNTTIASLMSMGWLVWAGGCASGQTAAPRFAVESIEPSEDLWNRCQLVVSSLEPAVRTGRTSPVITAHLAFVDVADLCRQELRQRADERDAAEQVAFLDLMLVASTHQAVLAYAEEGHQEQACRWVNAGAASAAQWQVDWADSGSAEDPATEARWSALREAARRENMFFDLFPADYCGQ